MGDELNGDASHFLEITSTAVRLAKMIPVRCFHLDTYCGE
jgi:hypothetical protein